MLIFFVCMYPWYLNEYLRARFLCLFPASVVCFYLVVQTCLVKQIISLGRQSVKGCMQQFSKPISLKGPLNLIYLDWETSSVGFFFDSQYFIANIRLGFLGLHCLVELVILDNNTLSNDRNLIRCCSVSFSTGRAFFTYNLPYHQGHQDNLAIPCAVQFLFSNLLRALSINWRLIIVYMNPCLPGKKSSSIEPMGCYLLVWGFLDASIRSFLKITLFILYVELVGVITFSQNGAAMDFTQSTGCWCSEEFWCYVPEDLFLRLPNWLNHPIGKEICTGALVIFLRNFSIVSLL